MLPRSKIHHSYSGTLVVQNHHKKNSQAEKFCLAFAPDYAARSSNVAMRGPLHALRAAGLAALPGAWQEVRDLSEYTNGDFYFGPEASERRFKEEAGNYKILHLAMHGQANVKSPLHSKLIFTSTGDSLEDNTLYACELYNLDLNADLVVLSSCETGSGKYIAGEGIMSLSRAFMYAGTPGVVQTLWSAEARASARIMTDTSTCLLAPVRPRLYKRPGKDISCQRLK